MRRLPTILTSWILITAWAVGGESEVRKWTSVAGTVIEGTIKELTPDSRRVMDARVKIETRDGRLVTVAFHQLSPADQAWIMNQHGEELAGRTPESPTPGCQEIGQARILPAESVECFDPKELLVPPAGMSLDRKAIPSRGEYQNRSSDAVNLMTNHLFWLCKAGCTRTEIGRDENRTWEKLQRIVASRFRGGRSWKGDVVGEFAVEMFQREGRGIVSIRHWKPRVIAPSGFDAINRSPALVLLELEAHQGEKYLWTTVVSVLEASGRDLTFFYRGARIRAEIEDFKPKFPVNDIKLPDGGTFTGYRLVFDPGDRSELVTELMTEELELRIKPDSFHVIDLALAVPGSTKP
jgi:hypothetical protein